ncbi:MAG: twin-arginine translocation signal domain-containing protein [candidate division Zixibacteria bacterium]|nr:twin-arginine translocation signal domain-containing protein [candidate division Zixibacteria bacterium]
MKRRDFIKATGLIGVGLAVGLSGAEAGQIASKSINVSRGGVNPGFVYPRGGCTESSLALFDRGPRGKDPFGLDR